MSTIAQPSYRRLTVDEDERIGELLDDRRVELIDGQPRAPIAVDDILP